jgi:hypothetical protein
VTWPNAQRIAVEEPSEQGKIASAYTGLNCVASGNEVWVLYGTSTSANGPDGSPIPAFSHLRVAHSSDRGKSIDWRSEVLDPEAGKFCALPNLVRDATGALEVSYYAGKMAGDANGRYVYARSTDAGKTFEPSVAVRAILPF